MSYSIGSWSFHALYDSGQMNIFGYLESLAHRYDVRHADIWNGMLLTTDDAYIALLERTLREEELTVACLAVDGANVWHKDPDIAQHQHKVALRYLDIARRLRVQTVRIDMGVMTPDITEEQFAHLVTRYSQYAAFAQDYGFRIGPQTHQPASQVAANLTRLSQALSTPAFGVVLDVSRWHEQPEAGDREAAPYTMHVHFDRAFVDLFGQPLLDKVRLLKTAGYEGCWSLEFRGGEREYIEVALDLAAIRRAVSLVSA